MAVILLVRINFCSCAFVPADSICVGTFLSCHVAGSGVEERAFSKNEAVERERLCGVVGECVETRDDSTEAAAKPRVLVLCIGGGEKVNNLKTLHCFQQFSSNSIHS